MKTRENYHTKQKEKILNYIRSTNKEFTVKELYDYFESNIGLTTIYRFVDKLVLDGLLEKRIREDHFCYYQYLEECDCSNHFYLRCNKCSKIIHVDCDCIKELSNHIILEHGFEITNDHIIINGICNECRGDNNA